MFESTNSSVIVIESTLLLFLWSNSNLLILESWTYYIPWIYQHNPTCGLRVRYNQTYTYHINKTTIVILSHPHPSGLKSNMLNLLSSETWNTFKDVKINIVNTFKYSNTMPQNILRKFQQNFLCRSQASVSSKTMGGVIWGARKFLTCIGLKPHKHGDWLMSFGGRNLARWGWWCI